MKQKIKISNQNVALEDLTRTKDYFLSIIAHDIKQPIISLFSLNKTLKYFANLKDFDRVDKIINSFDKSSMKTLKIIDNLFHWSFIQNQNKVEFQFHNVLKNFLFLIFLYLQDYVNAGYKLKMKQNLHR